MQSRRLLHPLEYVNKFEVNSIKIMKLKVAEVAMAVLIWWNE